MDKTEKVKVETEILGAEYLELIKPVTLEELKKKGFEITSIIHGFEVYIKKTGEDDGEEERGFGEDIGEAVYDALYEIFGE